MAVADIGAGTGLFVELFAQKVTSKGRVYALDISPKFVEHIKQRIKDAHLDGVEARLSGEDSVALAAGSIDVAFVCDTYHHFTHPQKMLRSIHEALRNEGRLIVVDFERIEGQSRQWTLDHVRADKQQVTKEITTAGFTLIDEIKIKGLTENYLLRFTKREQPGHP